MLLRQQKVVVAHGVQAPGDPVFHAFTDRFSVLSEEEFVSFWCIYLISLGTRAVHQGASLQRVAKDRFTRDRQIPADMFQRKNSRNICPKITTRHS